MSCEVNNKEINSQCAELLVRPTYYLSVALTECFSMLQSVTVCDSLLQCVTVCYN